MRPLEVEPPPDSFNPEALKQALLQGREALRQRYYGNGNGAALLRGHSRLLDDILRRAWHSMAMPDLIALRSCAAYFSDCGLVSRSDWGRFLSEREMPVSTNAGQSRDTPI